MEKIKLLEIKGQKVTLRPITYNDTELIVNWRNNTDVMSQFVYQKPFTVQGHNNWMKTMVETGKVVQYIIVSNEDNTPIGSIYYRDIDMENNNAEYGIFIGNKNCFGKGYGSEAAKLFVDFGFEVLGLHRIFLRVFSDNTRAIKSYKNAGFIEEGIARDMVLQNGKYRSMTFMSKLSGDKQ